MELRAATDGDLHRKIARQAAELTRLREVIERKNRELDAMHFVWCTGGCAGGVHRWSDGEITEAMVVHAERQAVRLRSWFTNALYRTSREDWSAARRRLKFRRFSDALRGLFT